MESVKYTWDHTENQKRKSLSNSFDGRFDQKHNRNIDKNLKNTVFDGVEEGKLKVLAIMRSGGSSYIIDYAPLLDSRIDFIAGQRMSKYQEQIGDLQNKFSDLLRDDNLVMRRKQLISEIGIAAPNFGKVEDAINNMENNDDIRFQIQCATRIINQIDILRKTSIFDENRRKLMAFLRTVMKINCDRKIFSEEQLEEFKNAFILLKHKDAACDNLAMIEKKLRKSGLRTMISWE